MEGPIRAITQLRCGLRRVKAGAAQIEAITAELTRDSAILILTPGAQPAWLMSYVPVVLSVPLVPHDGLPRRSLQCKGTLMKLWRSPEGTRAHIAIASMAFVDARRA